MMGSWVLMGLAVFKVCWMLGVQGCVVSVGMVSLESRECMQYWSGEGIGY